MVVEENKIFLMDSNSLMTPYRFYYAFDLIPAYWSELFKHLESGKIVVSDMVQGEIEKGKDALSEWLGGVGNLQVCNHVTSEIVSKYQEILQYVETCGMYKESAIREWSENNVADPWLIATDFNKFYDKIYAGIWNK